MNRMISFAGLSLALGLCACATPAQNVAATYTSPLAYAPFSCQELAMESQRVVHQAASVAGSVDERARTDEIALGVGLIAWPALFLVKGDGASAGELARLKGANEAIVAEGVRKGCSTTISVQGPVLNRGLQPAITVSALPSTIGTR